MDPVSPSGAAPSEKPNRISGYEVLSKIGEGGMGVVFKARQVSLDRIVALKVLSPRLASDERLIDRFFREAKVIARMSHPHIVRIYEVDRSKGGIYYYAMEYVEGDSAGKLLKSRGKLAVGEAVRICAQISRALAHAHEHGLMHRDVKPDNILLAADGAAKLADLGLARSFQEKKSDSPSLSTSGSIVGTPYYMAPEQAEGREVDARCDLYALGATLYHFVVGTPPFVADSAIGVITKHLTDPRPDPRRLNPAVPASLAAVIGKLMQIAPKDRYAGARQVAEDLEAIAAGRTPPHVGMLAPTVARSLSRPAVRVGIAAGILLLLAGFLLHRSRQGKIEREASGLLADAQAALARGQDGALSADRRIQELSQSLSLLDDLVRGYPSAAAAEKARAQRGDIAQALSVQQQSVVRQAEAELEVMLSQPPHRADRPLEAMRDLKDRFGRLASVSEDRQYDDAARTMAREALWRQRTKLVGHYPSEKTVAQARGELARRIKPEKVREALGELAGILPGDSKPAEWLAREIRVIDSRKPR